MPRKAKRPTRPKRKPARPSDISMLAEITTALSGAHDPDLVLEIVTKSAARLFRCDRSAVFFLRPDNHQKLALAHTVGLSDSFVAFLREFLRDIGGRLDAVRANQLTLIEDVRRGHLPVSQADAAMDEGIRAYAELSLFTQGDIVGVLTLYFDKIHRFTAAEIELLRTFASQTALAISNARIYATVAQELTRFSKQLQSLRAISREMTSTLDLNRLFEVVLERAIDYTRATAGCLHLHDVERNRFVMAAHLGYPPHVAALPESRSLSHIIASRTLRTGRVSLVADVRHDPDFIETPNKNISFLSLPIKHDEYAVGAITLESQKTGVFTDEDATFVTQIAAQAAIAIENARLFQQITESRDRVQAVLNSTREGMLVIDSTGRIVLANPCIEAWWQIKQEDLVGQNLGDLIKRPDLNLPAKLGFTIGDVLELLINLSQNLDVAPSKHVYRIERPAPRVIERSGTPVIDNHRRVIGWVLVLRDITEEKRVEQAREELTGMIVHDLRTPMTTVLGSLKLIQDIAVPNDSTGLLKDAVDVSVRSSKKMVLLVDSLLDIFKTEAGKMEIALKPHSLKPIIANVVEDLVSYAQQQDIELRDEVPADLPPVLVDSDKLERILTNLVDNAIKYTPSLGHVTLRASLVENGGPTATGEARHTKLVLCEVLDTGPGIPAEFRDRIFEQYVQITGREGRRRGTGLGLAFCKMAVEAHGGTIWVQNRPEGGSTFKFTLPLAPEVDV
jgi:signal transduction histidine kinase